MKKIIQHFLPPPNLPLAGEGPNLSPLLGGDVRRTEGGQGAFTLIEIIVSLSIMGVILVAIMGSFFSMSDVAGKTEINRQLQTNIKNAIETMAEDIRNHGVGGIGSDCSIIPDIGPQVWCDTDGNVYQLGQDDGGGGFVVASEQQCARFTSQCSLLKNLQPLTDSFIHIREASFAILGDEDLPRLGIYIMAQPSARSGVKPSLVANNIMYFQTTISRNFLAQ